MNYGQNLIGYSNMPALLYIEKFMEAKIWLIISNIAMAIMRNGTYIIGAFGETLLALLISFFVVY